MVRPQVNFELQFLYYLFTFALVRNWEMRKNQIIYLTHRVHNKVGNDTFSSAVEFTMYASAVVLVTYIYAMFKFANIRFILLESILLSTCILISYLAQSAMTLAVARHTNSKLCCQRGLHQITKDKEMKKILTDIN